MALIFEGPFRHYREEGDLEDPKPGAIRCISIDDSIRKEGNYEKKSTCNRNGGRYDRIRLNPGICQ